jgi:hypothetical protein
LQPLCDDDFVVRRAITPEEVFEHEYRDVGTFLDQLGQILTDDLAGEMPIEEVVQTSIDRRSFRSHP